MPLPLLAEDYIVYQQLQQLRVPALSWPIRVAVLLSILNFPKHWGIKARGGNMYGVWPCHEIERASMATVNGSGFQLQ